MVASDPRLPFGGIGRSRLRPRAVGRGHPRVHQRAHGVRGSRDALRPRRPQRRVPGRDARLVRRRARPGGRVRVRAARRSSSAARCCAARTAGGSSCCTASATPRGIRPSNADGRRADPRLRPPRARPSTTWRRRTTACSPPAPATGCRRSPSPEPGVRMAYVADPEGNLIELLDRTAVAHDRPARRQDRAHHRVSAAAWGSPRPAGSRPREPGSSGCDLDRDGAAPYRGARPRRGRRDHGDGRRRPRRRRTPRAPGWTPRWRRTTASTCSTTTPRPSASARSTS